jgi:hypothetical protein
MLIDDDGEGNIDSASRVLPNKEILRNRARIFKFDSAVCWL